MAQDQIIKIESALANSLNEIDRLYTRKMQGDMYRCSAHCCDKTSDSVEIVHACIETCCFEFDKARRYLKAEYDQFQNRLQRCVLQCSDDTLDKVGLNPSPSDLARYNRDYEACVISCVNKHMSLIPNFMKRMKEVLGKKAFLAIDTDDDPKSYRQPTLL